MEGQEGLLERLQTFLGKDGRFLKKAGWEMLYSDTCRVYPWIQSLKEMNAVLQMGIVGEPTCEFCGATAMFDDRTGTYRTYCSGCVGKRVSQSMKGRLVWNKGRTKEQDERVALIGRKVSASRSGRPRTKKEQAVINRMIETNRRREYDPGQFEKSRETNRQRYGVDSYLEKVNADGRKAILEKYGCYFPETLSYKAQWAHIEDSIRETCMKKYGVDWAMRSPEVQRKKYASELDRGGSTSAEERECIRLLGEKRSLVYVQYLSDQYPYRSDAYLPDEDVYIELHFGWTHGGRPFVGSSEDALIVDDWKRRGEESEYYRNALYNWTVRDVAKRTVAAENGVNLLVFYTKEDFLYWLSSLSERLIDFPRYALPKKPGPVDGLFEKMLQEGGTYVTSKKYRDLVLPFVFDRFFQRERKAWEDSETYRRVFQNRVQYLHKRVEDITPWDLLSGLSSSGILRAYSTFSPLIIRRFIRDYHVQSIYDPFGGWGSRLLGAWEIDYHYNDADVRLEEPMREMVEAYTTVQQPGPKALTFFDAGEYVPARRYDCVFTCPPYFRRERYGFDLDSSEKYPRYADWLEWWNRVVFNLKQVTDTIALVLPEGDLLQDMVRPIGDDFQLIETIPVSKKRRNHHQGIGTELLVVYRR